MKIPEKPRSKRRISLFKKRRRPDLRPFVREKKKQQGKKLLFTILGAAFVLFLIASILFAFKSYVLEKFFVPDKVLMNPQGELFPDKNQIENVIANKGLDASQIVFASDSATVTFMIKNKTQVTLSLSKNLRSQIDLVESIDRQITMDGKQAISIDLRYNKPIVKF